MKEMLKINRLVLLVEVLGLFLVCSGEWAPGVWAHGITVDGDDSDWVGTAPTEENSAIVDNGEFVWKDAADDIRTNAGLSSAATASLDITELRLTASTTALYVLVRFVDLRLSEDTTCTYPIVQIALDYADTPGATVFDDASDQNIAHVSSDAEWEYLLKINQSTTCNKGDVSLSTGANQGVVVYKALVGTGVRMGEYNHKVSTGMLPPGGFIEVEIPFSGWPNGIADSANYLSHRVHITVACFAHEKALGGDTYGAVYPLGTPSNIVDCVSPSANTDDEIEECQVKSSARCAGYFAESR